MTKLANSQWPEAVHPAHAGPPPDPDNGTGHPEQRQHEHVAGIPDSGIHHPSTGENSLQILKSYILEEQVRGAMEIALFIQNIQEERAEVALYIFINQVGVEISANPQNPKKFETFCLPDQHGSQAAGQREPCKQYPRGWFRGQR